MAEKGKSRGAGAKSKADKSRTSARGQARQAKKGSPKTPGRTPRQPSPGPDGEAPPREPLDVRPILDELLERVLSECALAAAARQRVPFTVSRARDAILFVAEWRFLARDEGDPAFEGDPEPERDGVWSEDEEPQTSPLDSRTRGAVLVDDESSRSSGEGSFEVLPATAEPENLLVCPDTVPDTVPVSSDRAPSEDLSATAAAESPLACPDTVPVLAVPVSPEQVPAAAAARDLGADIAAPVPGPPHPEPPVASRSTERVRRLSRDPARGGGGILSQPPGRSRRPSRPPRPGPAPLDAPRPRAPPPAAPSEPPAQAAQASAEGTASVGHQAPPPPPSARPSLASMQPRRASRGTGVPRPGPRRGAARWVLPVVKVVDVTGEPERARSATSRARLIPSGSPQIIPAAGRVPRAQPQLCDPWLASARLAPGVTVRWGRSERRGPAPPGSSGSGNHEQDDEAVKKAEKELKPILDYPVCRLSEYEQ